MKKKTLTAYIIPSKIQISKIIQSWVFLGSSLIKSADPLMKVAVLLAINILGPIGITAATSVIEAGIQKKIHGSGVTTLIISNEVFWGYNVNNFKWSNEWHNENCSSSWGF